MLYIVKVCTFLMVSQKQIANRKFQKQVLYLKKGAIVMPGNNHFFIGTIHDQQTKTDYIRVLQKLFSFLCTRLAKL